MRNKLNSVTENVLRQTALEVVRQLESKSENINLLKKQMECLELIDSIILHANKAPHGLIEVVFTDKNFQKGTPPERILLNARGPKISGFNLKDPESKKTLFRTVIIVDPQWSDDIEIFQCQYGLSDKYLR